MSPKSSKQNVSKKGRLPTFCSPQLKTSKTSSFLHIFDTDYCIFVQKGRLQVFGWILAPNWQTSPTSKMLAMWPPKILGGI